MSGPLNSINITKIIHKSTHTIEKKHCKSTSNFSSTAKDITV